MRFLLQGAIFIPVFASSVSAFVSNRKLDACRRITSLAAIPGADIEQETSAPASQNAGNSVQYRGKVNEIDYCIAPADVSLSRAYSQTKGKTLSNPTPQSLSLTQALNNASNRAVRRILLARCWPSEEALNLSLRLAAAAEKQAQEAREASGSTAKCPVPRPILNLLMRKDAAGGSVSKGRTNEQYVMDQIKSFRDLYGSLPGHSYAEAYLESVLSLATIGEETPRVKEVLESGIYDESYKRVLSVLKSVGAVFETIPGGDRLRLAKKLNDQDICLSMVDKINLNRQPEPEKNQYVLNSKSKNESKEEATSNSDGKRSRLKFWMKEIGSSEKDKEHSTAKKVDKKQKGDVGAGIVLSAEEPTMTRQLNSLSNIVQRALLFGGDQELLVLSETLDSNRKTFIERWYPDTGTAPEKTEKETRPGVQYLNNLIQLLRRAYDDGVVLDLEPTLPLIQSFSNSYEKLMASLVELDSGYIRPAASKDMSAMKPRTPREELGRFAVMESQFRGGEASYPEDLFGSWEVKDEIGGETIGTSTVVLEPEGQVTVAPPLQGLRWRLDPGPTHLDTCTFQVLELDGTVLQYRGFIDRGARLEARFSKRPTRIRGSVMFQMRDGDFAWKDLLPINYKTGTTKFVMTKIVDDSRKNQ